MNRMTRILSLHRSLLAGDEPRAAGWWAKRFSVNQRTVLRDLAFLKDELSLPVIFDASAGGYRYDGPNIATMPELKPNKWTRLLTLIHRICAEPGKTAKELAEETGCTERTIFRDVRELEEVGFPLYNDGGYRFAADAFLPALNLDAEETFSLFVAVRLLEAQDIDQLGEKGRRALEKLLRGTEETKRPDYGQLRESVQVSEVSGETGAHLLTDMQTALCQGCQITIHYRGMKDAQAKPRRLDPMGLFCFRQAWYLHASITLVTPCATFA
jgi:predicted DNA-binding transcriptional regulator YafY